MKILITSGGTQVPIDSIRHLGNASGGRTGAEIAKAALHRNLQVVFVHAKHSWMPWSEDLTVGPEEDVGTATARITRHLPFWNNHPIKAIPFRTFEQYRNRTMAAIVEEKPAAVVLAAAVSDFSVAAAPGKLSSKQTQIIELHPAQKVMAEIRQAFPRLPIIGFKDLVSESPEQLIEIAYRLTLEQKLTFCVANLTPDPENFRTWKTFLVTPERGILQVPREFLADDLLSMFEQRIPPTSSYVRTQHSESSPPAEEERQLRSVCTRWAGWGLFTPYQQNDPREFGSVACRHGKAMLITTRGSSKSQITPRDVAIVSAYNHPQMVSSSAGAKPSRNASLAWQIFAARPEINWVVHTHVTFHGAPSTRKHTVPGTIEEWDTLRPYVANGACVILQPLHGTLLLLKSTSELEDLLLAHNIFNGQDSSPYEMAYGRFQNEHMARLVSKHVPNLSAKILDAASGTGLLVRQLQQAGYTNLSASEPSQCMRSRNRDIEVMPHSLQEIQRCGTGFDAIVIRQAINYIPEDTLPRFFADAKVTLRPGGLLIFDTFKCDSNLWADSIRQTVSETPEYRLTTTEFNTVDFNRIRHGQITFAWPKGAFGTFKQIYDFNRFYGLSPRFEGRAAQAGLRLVEKITDGKSLRYVWAS
jgi:SAM-dependent methyltransferase